MSDAEHDVKWPTPSEGEFIIPEFVFEDGSKLPELRLHYWTLGKLRKNADGRASNAVMIMHGTTGAGANFFQPIFAGELFNRGQLLDAKHNDGDNPEPPLAHSTEIEADDRPLDSANLFPFVHRVACLST